MYSAVASAASVSGASPRANTRSNPAGAISRAISPTSGDGGTKMILGVMQFPLNAGCWLEALVWRAAAP